MATLDVTRNVDRTLKANYARGTVMFTVRYDKNRSVSAPRLSSAEWERLVTWVAHQKAEEAVRKGVVQ